MLRIVTESWRRLATGSLNDRILSAAILVAGGNLVVKLTAMVKDIVVVDHFGLGDALDAFFLAVAVPAFAVTVIGQSFSGAFMPEYVRVREQEGPERAKRLFANIMVVNFVLLLGACLLLAVAGRPILALVASEFAPEKRELVYQLYLVLLPFIVLEGQVILWGSVLHAGEKFALAAFAPILTPLAIVALVIVVAPGLGVAGMAWGTVLGCGLELAVLGVALHRRGLLPVPAWTKKLETRKQVVNMYVPLVLGAMIMNASTVIDQVMASWLGPGSVAALTYGNKLPSFVAGIGVTALGTAVLPHFSRLIALGDYNSIRHTLNTYLRWIAVVSVPITLVVILCSEWIVRVLFERAAFTREDTVLVSFIQQLYLLQVPFFVIGVVGVRLLIAMSRTHLVTIMAVVNLAVNVAGNLIFMRWLGVGGIALSTSVVYVVSMSMILWLVYWHLSALQRTQLAPT